MNDVAPLSLDSISLLLVWTAITTYLLAFVAFSIDLAQRAARTPAPQRQHELVAAGSSSHTRALLGVEDPRESPDSIRVPPSQRPRLLWARIGTSLTALAFLFHVAGTVTRGIAAERVPWANMYEFALTGTVLIVAVYLAVLRRYDLRFLGAFLIGMIVLLLGGSSISFYVEVVPLMDPLKSVWLVIHVFVASLATALFAIACGISITQLLQNRRTRRLARASADACQEPGPSFLNTVPATDTLETLAYRFAIVGFMFWTFTLIAGAIWANDSWGRYWGFDVKEVWTFVIWVLYAGYIHARATRGWRGSPSAWLSIVGFAAVLFNFTIVNMYFQGLHSYSGLS
ncbi:c-type cytochrome biogenesis protein CcsB [Microbacterium sp. p3-SID336]|uniref:c-type cytochrome biogenesis protein CcsB n=1 Tax=Microbacterium sp. p3-SID336 TaxID=2916212 RepID=UPI0021A3CFA8|nr:c-type cytochrome biogenesis protein CcsB [Microbacterium sp. p3-SID336]MCT1478469.1 c-type cytochrome biogenesis protein CcsB [Microbacterium sp. p3-SID336]